jgi:hypothetical protein
MAPSPVAHKDGDVGKPATEVLDIWDVLLHRILNEFLFLQWRTSTQHWLGSKGYESSLFFALPHQTFSPSLFFPGILGWKPSTSVWKVSPAFPHLIRNICKSFATTEEKNTMRIMITLTSNTIGPTQTSSECYIMEQTIGWQPCFGTSLT